MKRIKENEVVRYQFETLSTLDGVTHSIFTRRGGVSKPPFDSLNIGSTVGDELLHVKANRQRMADELGIHPDDVRTVWQVHGSEVHIVLPDEPNVDPPPKADGLVTNLPGIALTMRFADCVPLIFVDPVQRVVGLAHAGWRGTIKGAGPATVRTMVEAFACLPENIVAGIGPSIGPCCYEVGPEVEVQVNETWVYGHQLLIPPVNGNGHGSHLDLWEANRLALKSTGVGQIELARLCTSCHTYEFFSHRAEAGRTGRFGAMVVLGGRGAY